jgi:leucyl-tRNA synthetase
MSEELWINYVKSGFISNEPYSKFKEKEISEKDELGEYLIQEVSDDISEILKVTKINPKKIFIYTSPSWKQDIFKKAISLKSKNILNMSILMKEIIRDPLMKLNAKQVSQFVGKVIGEVKKLSDCDENKYTAEINEKDYLKSAEDYLRKIFSCEINIFNADDKDIYDPNGKKHFAAHLRPAIFIE